MTTEEFWRYEFGTKLSAIDFSGKPISKSDYGKKIPTGWVIDHIQPLAQGGKNIVENKQIININTAKEKADKTQPSMKNTPFEFERRAFGGELGIRTPGSFHYNGFQDRRFRPLSQLSAFYSLSQLRFLFSDRRLIQ